jgi:hypothetical protein
VSAIQPTSGVVASKRELARGSGIALAIATVVLTFAILPAEYGIDPTGVGGILGLTAREAAAPEAVPEPPIAAGSSTIASRQKTSYRTDTKQITLPPGKGLEIKTSLEKGAALLYSWKTDGAVVNHDFHGEPAGSNGDEFESFIKEAGVAESRGVLIAPFTGEHGWFWGNTTDAPVVVTLYASGFYADIFEK